MTTLVRPSSSALAALPLTALCLTAFLFGCTSSRSKPNPADAGVAASGDASSDDASVDIPPAIYTVNGVAQKGPFGNGTNITIAECDNSMVPTGRTFTTSITDNRGLFSLPNVQLSGKYVRLTADGFYFDEVANQASVSRIALNALADVTNRSTVNVNLLTHLEQPRIELLVASGISFTDAKLQAQREILAIFDFTLSDAAPSETLDIARGTADDAILLAVSAILQGRRTPGELTELLSNIASDIRADGVLDSTTLGTALMNGAVLLNLAAVRSNLVQRYASMGATATIGDFEKYVKAFISRAKYSFTDVVTYPAVGAYGTNFLDPSVSTLPTGPLSFLATLPRGTSVKVVLRGQGSAIWGYALGSTSCWTVATYDQVRREQTYTIASSTDVRTCDLNVQVMPVAFPSANGGPDVGPDKSCIRVEYFENFELTGGTTPTASKLACDERIPTMDGGLSNGGGPGGGDAGGPGGGIDQPCKSGNVCDTGLSCVLNFSGRCPNNLMFCCKPAGAKDQPCKMGTGNVCDTGLSCVSEPSICPKGDCCQPAGAKDQPCKMGNACDTGLSCVVAPNTCPNHINMCCQPAGAKDQPCKPGTSNVCDTGLSCVGCQNYPMGCCQPAGAKDQPCKGDGSCDPGLSCVFGSSRCPNGMMSCCEPAQIDGGA